MRRVNILSLLLLVFTLAACGGATTPTPTVAPATQTPEAAPTEAVATAAPPTEEPTATAPAEEASPLETMEHTPDTQLIDVTWQWERRDPNGNQMEAITVPNPENYTLLFNADGTFNAQLDCNRGNGQYATSGDGGIFMELGPMTLAACEPDSLSDQMMAMFGPAQDYRFEEDGAVLVFSWAAGGPLDYFRNAEAAPAPGQEEVQAIPPDAIQINLQGLAETFSWEVQPAAPIPPGPGGQGFPPHILLTFDGQTAEDALNNLATSRRLYIFPTQAYVDLYNEAGNTIVADQVTRLQALIGEAEGRQELPSDPMPLLPPPNSFMDRWVQFSDLNFGVGSGVRYVSDSPFRQDLGPWTNATTAYYYQGLTDNGRFYVSLIWPVSTNSLPNTDADVPDELQAQASNPETASAYQQETREALNALEPSAWTPDLASLDALVQSLTFPTEGQPSLTGTTWQWVSTTTPVAETAVDDPTRYTITFNEDGSANIVADCNSVGATYTADDGAISIVLGPTTLAACPEDSLDQQFLEGLSNAALYFFEQGELFMDLPADGGTLRFTAAQAVDLPEPEEGAATGTVIAPDGVFIRSGPGTDYPAVGTVPFEESGPIIGRSQDGQWWVIEIPVTDAAPEGQGWVSAQFVEATNAENVPVVATPPLEPLLTATTWQWVSLTDPAGVTAVSNPETYTILFNADGSANIVADCNSVGATYTTDGSSITITLGPSTLAACPEGSLDQQFLTSLENAALYFFEEGDLFIDLMADGGTLRLAVSQPATDSGSSDATTDAALPVSSAVGIEFQLVSFGPAGAEQPVLPGTQITATFSETEVAGSAGCNTYSATLTPVEDFFTVGPIATTRQTCPEPPGIMDQEQAFLAALSGTNGFQWASEQVGNNRVITAGQLFYTLEDGTNGVINLLVP